MEGVRSLEKVNEEIVKYEARLASVTNPLGLGGFGGSLLTGAGSQSIIYRVMYQLRLDILKAEKQAITAYVKDITDCVKMDKHIKLMDVDIANKRREALKGDGNKSKAAQKYADTASAIRSFYQKEFVKKDCANQIENKKALETAGIIGKEIEKYEDDVLSGSGKEQKQLFIIGGVVLLVALGIIMYSTRKK